MIAVTAMTVLATPPAAAQDDVSSADLWLRYEPVGDPDLLDAYREAATAIVVENVDQNPVYRHTPELSMEPGSEETLVETSLEAKPAARGRLTAIGLSARGPSIESITTRVRLRVRS